MGSQADLDNIKKQIMADKENKDYTDRGIGPLYKADVNAKIAIVGQAPGRVAEETGLIWNDQSGDRLRKWMGVDREMFYETDLIAHLPMDFYYPGKAQGKGQSGDAPPRKGFAEKWHPRLLENMPQVKTIILVGNYANKYYLGKNMEKNLTKTVRSYEKYMPEFFPLVHPSPLNQRWMKKNPWFEEEVVVALYNFVQKALDQEDQTSQSWQKPYYVYMLRCQDQSLYTGITTDLDRRFAEHQRKTDPDQAESKAKAKGAKYTAAKKPLAYEAAWQLANRSEAQKLEYKIKKLSKKAKEDLVKGEKSLEDLLDLDKIRKIK